MRTFSLAALTVLELSPPEMIEVAARAGYDSVGLRLIPATRDEPHFSLLDDAGLLRETRERLRDAGISVLDVEILRLIPDSRIVEDFSRVLDVGAQLGASEVLVAGNDEDRQRTTDNFAALCELAAPFGLYPHLEFMPWTGVRNLTQARSVVTDVRDSGHDNACLLVDAFHFDRSPSRLDDLAQVPPEWMHYAQLCDVAGPCPDNMDEIIHQARAERQFPGDGDMDLTDLLQTLPADMPLSLEVPTQGLRSQGVTALDRAQAALSSTRQLVGHG